METKPVRRPDRIVKKSQAQLLAVFLFLLLIPTTIIVAQNATNPVLSETGSMIEIDLCAGVICEDSAATCPDGYQAACSNTCDSATGQCTSCAPDCAGHEAEPPDPCEGIVCPETDKACSDGFIAGCIPVCDSSTGECPVCNPDCSGHEADDLCIDIICSDSAITCPDSIEVNCPNACDPPTGQCSDCIPDCTGHDIKNETCEESWECEGWGPCIEGEQTRICNDINSCGPDTNKPSENQGCAEPEPCNLACEICEELNTGDCACSPVTSCIPDDGCCPGSCNYTTDTDCLLPDECSADEECDDSNICTDDACSGTTPRACYSTPIIPCCGNGVCEGGETYISCPSDCEEAEIPEPEPEINVTPEPEIPAPLLEVELTSPERVTRGETANLEAMVVNTGSSAARNVIVSWRLADGFEILSGDQTKGCGDLEPGASCTSIIIVQASYSTALGINDVGVGVSYE